MLVLRGKVDFLHKEKNATAKGADGIVKFYRIYKVIVVAKVED